MTGVHMHMAVYFRQNTPWHDPVPRVREQSLNFTICPVTTIKIRLYPRGCEMGYGVVEWGRGIEYKVVDTVGIQNLSPCHDPVM